MSCTPEQSHRGIEEKSTLDTTTLAILAENGKALEVNEAEKERDVAVLSLLSTLYQNCIVLSTNVHLLIIFYFLFNLMLGVSLYLLDI